MPTPTIAASVTALSVDAIALTPIASNTASPKRDVTMFEFKMPPLVQTEEQKAYCATKLEEAEAAKKAATKRVGGWLGASLGAHEESRVQIKRDMQENRVNKVASFCKSHGVKVCVGDWTGLTKKCASDADKLLEQIVLGFDFGMHVSKEEINAFEKEDQS